MLISEMYRCKALALACVPLCGFSMMLMSGCETQSSLGGTEHQQLAYAEESRSSSEELPTVDVVEPIRGGIEHVVVTPGTVQPYRNADLYAKVSGFLVEQSVDIGDHVEKGQELARISVPEYEKQVEKDKATVAHQKARVRQMEARLAADKAHAQAAKEQVKFAEADLQAKTAYRKFREKQFHRIEELRDQRAVDDRLVDEKEDQFAAAMAAENASMAAIATAKQQAAAADADVIRAIADVDDTKAELKVAEAELDRSQVFLQYTHIISPYTGVITHREFFPGDFVRSAETTSEEAPPMFKVEQTDIVRVIVQVPDRDVPFVDVGDKAYMQIDALPGREFEGKVSRFAFSEDYSTRTMQTEVDVPNKDDILRSGMYGRTKLVLQVGSKDALTIPSIAIVDRLDGRQATVRVVRNGRYELAEVTIGVDNGIQVEIVKGLQPSDQVIVRTGSSLDPGQKVAARVVKPAKAPNNDH